MELVQPNYEKDLEKGHAYLSYYTFPFDHNRLKPFFEGEGWNIFVAFQGYFKKLQIALI